MASWIGRSRHIARGLMAMVCFGLMAVSITAVAAGNAAYKPKAGFIQPAKQYRAYVTHVAPLFNALHQAEIMLGSPETLTLQRWSAWLGGWDSHYQEVMQQAKEAHFGNVGHYQSYHQLQQTHAVLHQVQQRMQQHYLGLPSNASANADTMDRAYQQVQQCLALEDTLQPLLYNSQTGRQ
ncbi:MAG: hypothetical protein QE263_03775 [Vampirovibrionales bacterium]|nr:hypothetical protein [Vampirovibrionales bacterium]